MWDSSLIREFAEDFESDDEDDAKSAAGKEDEEDESNDKGTDQDMVIKGPLNYLFPIMLK